ncbi:YvcK family protein [Candidatus Saccharibacteria bacterium]|nr:YvcK family protein [Candidatus Saccharibacteria bacterium]
MLERSDARVVVIGGGTGSFTVLSGLKNHFTEITAIVSMADDGSSTGQLRDELGVLPPGDVRQCLVALSRSPRVRDLFGHRFSNGHLKGHTFGNLFLAALEDMTGDFRGGVALASEVLDIVGYVEPITLDQITVVADDGDSITRGEDNIENTKLANRPKLWLEPIPLANPAALTAIEDADLIIISPGSLYESLGATLIVPGVADALKSSTAKSVYVCNLMNKPGHTDGFHVHDYASELERLAGVKFLDYVLYNSHPPIDSLIKHYAADGELPVLSDTDALVSAHYRSIGVDLLSASIHETSPNDPKASHRTLIRHDPERLARQILKLL